MKVAILSVKFDENFRDRMIKLADDILEQVNLHGEKPHGGNLNWLDDDADVMLNDQEDISMIHYMNQIDEERKGEKLRVKIYKAEDKLKRLKSKMERINK